MKFIAICFFSFWIISGAVAQNNTEGMAKNDSEQPAQHFESESGFAGKQLKTESDVDPHAHANFNYASEVVEEDSSLYSCSTGYKEPSEEQSKLSAEKNKIHWDGSYMNYEATITPGSRKVDYYDPGVIYRSREEIGGSRKVDFESEVESYSYEKNKDGTSTYDYFIDTGDELMTVKKSKDGSGKVKYKGKFDDLNKINDSGVIQLGEPTE